MGRLSEPAEILAVQTRAQQRKDEQERHDDDKATAQSGSTPLPLPQFDDSLFEGGRLRKRLTKQQKRMQAQERAQKNTEATGQWDRRLTELSRQEIEEEQQADDSLEQVWTVAKEGHDGFSIKGGLLHHLSKDDWGDDRDQLVVPQRFRTELVRLAHGYHLGAHLGAKKDSYQDTPELLLEGPQQGRARLLPLL